MWWYYATKAAGDTFEFLGKYSQYRTNQNLLEAQADLYKQNAENAMFEGRRNADNIYDQGETAKGTVNAGYAAQGININNSQTASNATTQISRGVNDDVYSVMYNAATQANQQKVQAQLAEYQRTQNRKTFILSSIGQHFNNAANAISFSGK